MFNSPPLLPLQRGKLTFGKNLKVQGTFNGFKCSIPLHFDMLNATPYSLSKEGNLLLGRIKRFKGVTLE
jgi:hypothetical protein